MPGDKKRWKICRWHLNLGDHFVTCNISGLNGNGLRFRVSGTLSKNRFRWTRPKLPCKTTGFFYLERVLFVQRLYHHRHMSHSHMGHWHNPHNMRIFNRAGGAKRIELAGMWVDLQKKSSNWPVSGVGNGPLRTSVITPIKFEPSSLSPFENSEMWSMGLNQRNMGNLEAENITTIS